MPTTAWFRYMVTPMPPRAAHPHKAHPVIDEGQGPRWSLAEVESSNFSRRKQPWLEHDFSGAHAIV